MWEVDSRMLVSLFLLAIKAFHSFLELRLRVYFLFISFILFPSKWDFQNFKNSPGLDKYTSSVVCIVPSIDSQLQRLQQPRL